MVFLPLLRRQFLEFLRHLKALCDTRVFFESKYRRLPEPQPAPQLVLDKAGCVIQRFDGTFNLFFALNTRDEYIGVSYVFGDLYAGNRKQRIDPRVFYHSAHNQRADVIANEIFNPF
jgi:hypothetical protein